MRIGIIGYGFVGSALASTLRSSAPYVILDPVHSRLDLASFLAHEPEIVFICVPTPTINNSCDDSLIVDYVEQLKDYNGVVVVKSTIPLHTVEKITAIRDVVVWPELLREKHAMEDMANPTLLVIGADSDSSYKKVEEFIKHDTLIQLDTGVYLQNPFRVIQKGMLKRVSAKEASIFKYAVNAFLATKVVFMHQLYQWLERRGDEQSWNNVKHLLENEGRIGQSHLQVPGEHGFGYDGTCFPKDVKALLEQVAKDGTAFGMLAQTDIQNERLRTKIL